jgi:hypothetical protein
VNQTPKPRVTAAAASSSSSTAAHVSRKSSRMIRLSSTRRPDCRAFLIEVREEGREVAGVRHPSFDVRKWWNWQTHHLEGVAPKGVGVQIPPSAPISMIGPNHLAW